MRGLRLWAMFEASTLFARTWFAREITLERVRRAIASGSVVIRIASGYFTVRGWGLIRTETQGKRLLLLVGLDDPDRESARAALVREILHDLATGIDSDRRGSVQDLLHRLRAGEAIMVDARSLDHHAKLYLVDESIAIVTSANATELVP